MAKVHVFLAESHHAAADHIRRLHNVAIFRVTSGSGTLADDTPFVVVTPDYLDRARALEVKSYTKIGRITDTAESMIKQRMI